jgi:RHS repeat-associated protein
MIKHIYIILLFTVLFFKSNAQQCNSGQKTAVLTSTCATQYTTSLNTSSVAITAREQIAILPGFSIVPNGSRNFSATIDEKLTLPSEYNTTAVPIPSSGQKPDNSKLVGAINGSALVSENGAANYQVPISIPAGAAGMQPTISLAYNSMAGDGLLGVGWDITGLSNITRTPKTYINDYNMGTYLDDRFLIDGKRLMLQSGNWGAIGSVYYTEMNDQSSISITTDGFLVQLRNGTKIQYGYTGDSRQLLSKNNPYQRVIYSWKINKITDLNGNFMTYSYASFNGQTVIDHIDYSANQNAQPTALNTIQFYYDTKYNARNYYISGYVVANSNLLREIKTFSSNTMVNNYVIAYTKDEIGSNYLNTITKIENDGSQVNPTIISWKPVDNTIREYNPTINSADHTKNYEEYWTAGDYNGDGLSDLLEIKQDINPDGTLSDYDYQGFVAQRNSSGSIDFSIDNSQHISLTAPTFGCSNTWYIPFQSGYNMFGDIKGVGKNQIIIPKYDQINNTSTLRFYVMGEPNPIETDVTTCPFPAVSIADLNNDGTDEIIYFERASNKASILYDMGGSPDTRLTSDYTPNDIFVLDLNNDGLKDILLTFEKGYCIYKNNGDALHPTFTKYTRYTSPQFNSTYSRIKPGDFNGDGLIDLLLNEHCNNKWHLALNDGNFGFTILDLSNFSAKEEEFTDKNNDKDDCIVMDFDHDGKSDVLMIDATYLEQKDISGKWGTYMMTSVIWYKSDGISFTVLPNSFIVQDENYTFNKYNILGDFDGDGKVDLYSHSSDLLTKSTSNVTDRIYSTFNNSDAYSGFGQGMVSAISDGMNRSTSFTYQPLTCTLKKDNTTFYTKETNADNSAYFIDIQPPLSCVNSMTTTDGHTIAYSYSGAKIHTRGRGFLGFSSVTATNADLNKKSVSTSSWYLGTNIKNHKTTLTTTSGTPLSSVEDQFNYTSTTSFINYYFYSTTNRIETNDVLGTSTTTTSTYDNLGNLTSVNVDLGLGNSQLTKYDAYTYAGSWYKYIPQLITTFKTHADEGIAFKNQTYFQYDTKGNLLTKTNNYNISDKQVTTTYGIDVWGNPTLVTSTASSEGGALNASRTSKYDPSGRFIIASSDFTGTTTTEYNAFFGVPTKITSPTGLVATFAYNSRGELTRKTFADGNYSDITFGWTNDGPTGAVSYTKETPSNAVWVETWYDIFGRELRTATVGFNGVSSYSDVVYNTLGQTIQKKTYFADQLKSQVTLTYDPNDGRITNELYNTGKNIDYTYTAKSLKNSVTENRTRVTQYEKDLWGNIKKVTSPDNSTLTYYYKSNGHPSKISAPTSDVTFDYDGVGNQITLNDPDAGSQSFRYDGLDRLTYEKDANGNETTQIYNPNGQLTSKITSGTEVAHYDYYTSGMGIGQIQKVTSDNGSWDSYEYDYLGRRYKTTRYIDSKSGSLVFENHYDAKGNVDQIKYPNGVTIGQQFDSYGNLQNVSNGSTNIWTLNTVNATILNYSLGNGQVTEKTFDAYGLLTSIITQKAGVKVQNMGYSFDAAKGLLNWRTDNLHSLKEGFVYDNMDRLTNWQIYKNGSSTYSTNNFMTYNTDKSTNILTKSNTGQYSCNATGSHAINSLLVLPTLTTDVPTNDQDLTNNKLGKVETITENGNSLSITYGTDCERIKTDYSGNTNYTKYFDGLYEVQINSDGTKKEYYYIKGGDGLAAVLIKTNGDAGTLSYIHKDHLGSYVRITKADGSPLEELSYDPWGRRRDPGTWNYFSLGTKPTFLLDRGYTGHEHLDDFNLINMNGRIYDSQLAMFISTDPFVQAPDNVLNFNRYSYCMNNPLKYTDPSGNFIFTALAVVTGQWWAIPMAIGADIGMWQGGSMANGTMNPFKWDYSSGKTWGYMAGGAAAGGFAGYVGGGIAPSGGMFSNTTAIIASSYINSVGTKFYTSGESDLSVSFGVASYDFDISKWGYLGENGNSTLMNVGYGFGALADVQDLFALNMGTNVNYNAMKDPIGHGSLTNKDLSINISKGFESGETSLGDGSVWTWGNSRPWGTSDNVFKFSINNVNRKLLEWMTGNIARGKDLLGVFDANYSIWGNTCASQVSRSLWYSGVWGLNPFTIHPLSLYFQLMVRQAGIYSSPYLYQMPNK